MPQQLFLTLFLSAALLGGSYSAKALENISTTTAPGKGPDTSDILKHLVMPMANAALGGANQIKAIAPAAGKACSQVSTDIQNKSAQRRQPELARIRVCMTLLMRVNTGLLKSPLGYRVYPGPKDFDRFALRAQEQLNKFASGLPKGKTWTPREFQTVNDTIYRALKTGTAFLPTYRGKGVPPEPPLDPAEQAYFPDAAGFP